MLAGGSAAGKQNALSSSRRRTRGTGSILVLKSQPPLKIVNLLFTITNSIFS
jgi:hypothetical protein